MLFIEVGGEKIQLSIQYIVNFAMQDTHSSAAWEPFIGRLRSNHSKKKHLETKSNVSISIMCCKRNEASSVIKQLLQSYYWDDLQVQFWIWIT